MKVEHIQSNSGSRTRNEEICASESESASIRRDGPQASIRRDLNGLTIVGKSVGAPSLVNQID